MAEIDPVCGRQVETPTEELTFHHKRQRYHFCSERCLKAFERRVEKERLQELARAGRRVAQGAVESASAVERHERRAGPAARRFDAAAVA